MTVDGVRFFFELWLIICGDEPAEFGLGGQWPGRSDDTDELRDELRDPMPEFNIRDILNEAMTGLTTGELDVELTSGATIMYRKPA